MPKIIENLPQRLTEEARRQIEQSGFSAMTIRSVAKGCGVGVGTVLSMILVGRVVALTNRLLKQKVYIPLTTKE